MILCFNVCVGLVPILETGIVAAGTTAVTTIEAIDIEREKGIARETETERGREIETETETETETERR